MNRIIQLMAGLLLLAGLLTAENAQAQGERKVITFSGIIVDGDSSYGVRGVHVYVPRAGRGTVTDPLGFFTMPVLVGDTVVISAIGYKTHKLVIPRREDNAFSVMINLNIESTFLPEVEILPFPTEELFKEAFIALKLPDQEKYENMERNLAQERLVRMSAAMPMDGSLNYRNYMNTSINTMANRNFATTLPLLNPFAWAQFIQSIKRGDLKKKKND
ncbi:carboxypeptidase-like regulatory domain-containing protein [Rhodoflexus sp.]